MPPQMTHQASRNRAERAYRLWLRGRSWPEVAEAEGFKSRQSARKAVHEWLRKNPSEDIEMMRRATGDTLTMVIDRVLDSLDAAQAKGDHRGVAELGRVVMDGLDKRAKLQGLHIAVPTLIDVNVQTTAVAILERAESELLAIVSRAEGQAAAIEQRDVIDAEIVP